MRIGFLGAARTVTGSQHLITVNGSKILLDCGLYQGRDSDAQERNRDFGFDIDKLDAVILSHAHIDHSGNLPKLVKSGYEGPIFATEATAHLTDLLLRDSAHIQEAEAEAANERRAKRGQSPVAPLYGREDAARVAQQLRKQKYDEMFEVAPGVRAQLVEAGHILGSAAVVLEIEENGSRRRVWYSGDIGRRNLPLVRDPELPRDVDTLIMECTYGDKSHLDPLQAVDELRQVLARAIDRGGKVIIPSFAVGRTQEIVYHIHQMIEHGELPPIPVFVDSPLASEASKVFMDHPECFDDEVRGFLRRAGKDSLLNFHLLTYVESVEDSKALVEREGPLVVLSASGMAENGRIVHHIRHNLDDPRTTILIVSYQSPHTLGHALAVGAERVEIWGETYERKADVVVIPGLSAHAGQRLLFEYATAVKGQVKQTFLVHGEEGPAGALQERLQDAGMGKVYYPFLNQTMEI